MNRQPSSSSNLHQWEYDVFVSFRGGDLRKGFMSHFLKALEQVGINCFKDNSEEGLGMVIESKLLEAIHHSKVALVVFSRNYADSRWCLNELAEILECHENFGDRHHFMPIFYDVEPGDVRNQRGDFGIGFEGRKKENQHQQILRWQGALAKAGSVSGFHLMNDANGVESFLVDIIVKKLQKIFPDKCHSSSTANAEKFAAHNKAVADQTKAHNDAVDRQTRAHLEAVERQTAAIYRARAMEYKNYHEAQ